MTSASWALQQAAFAALAASDAVRAVAAERIFDAVPYGTAFPYIVIGDDSEGNSDTATEDGSEHVLSVHIWSRAGGHKEIKRAAAAVRQTLDDAALTLDGHKLIDIRFLSADFRRETDGETYRALLRFRAVTEPQ